MKKRYALPFAISLIVAALIFGVAPRYVENQMNVHLPHDPFMVSDQAQALHESLIVGDLHADSFLWDRDLSKRDTIGAVEHDPPVGIAHSLDNGIFPMPNGRFLPYEGIGHAPFLEDPDRFAADLSAFIQDTRKEQAA